MMRCAALRISRAVVPRMARGLALPPHRVVAMPALSPTMTQGNIAKYVASVGDELEPGDRLAEIETDKATVDFEVVDDGVLAKILLEEGSTDVDVGTPMAVLVDDAADVAAIAAEPAATFTADGPAASAAATPEPAAAPAPAAATPAPPPPPPPAAAAAAPAASVAGVSIPAVGGRIYWNETKGWFRA